MIYSIRTGSNLSNKILTVELKDTYRNSIKKDFVVTRHVPKGGRVVGYLSGNADKFAGDFTNALKMYVGNDTYYCQIVQDGKSCGGYVQVDSGDFVGIPAKRGRFVVPISVGVLITAVLCFAVVALAPVIDNLMDGPANAEDFGLTAEVPESVPDKEVGQDGDWVIADSEKGDELKLNTETSAQDSNVFNGYSEAWVSKEHQTLPLANAKENTTYARYIIYNGDELLFESDLIAPDSHINWNAYESLEKEGTYALKQVCKFFEPVYNEAGEITDFAECSVGITNPNFSIQVR